MKFNKLKSYAKVNLALNVIGKNQSLHKIETIVAFISLHDEIQIKNIKSKKHIISFNGKFSHNIQKKNTISKLLEILERKGFLRNIKFRIKIKKKIPIKAGLGGGSMNAANILRYLLKKKIINVTQKELREISRLVGSDVILGLNSTNLILNSKNQIKYFYNCKKIYMLIIKPKFGCSTKYIYSKVKKFSQPKLLKLNRKIFSMKYLKKMNNALEPIVLSKYSKLRSLKLYLESLSKTNFVRMTGSGSALVAYFQSKKSCERAAKQFKRKYKKIWCISSKTI